MGGLETAVWEHLQELLSSLGLPTHHVFVHPTDSGFTVVVKRVGSNRWHADDTLTIGWKEAISVFAGGPDRQSILGDIQEKVMSRVQKNA